MLPTSLCRGCRRCLEDTVSVLLENVLARQTLDNTRLLLFLGIKKKKTNQTYQGLEMCQNTKCTATEPDLHQA